MSLNKKLQVHNNHNVYILGAGFSADFGMPVQSNFIETMKLALEYWDNQKQSEKRNAIEEVLKYRLSASAAAYRINLNLDNIEDLFSLSAFESKKVSKVVSIAL